MRYQKILYFYLSAIAVGIATGIIGSLFQIATNSSGEYLIKFHNYLNSIGVPAWFYLPLITLTMVLIAWFMVIKIAPEAAGSGVQHIEGVLMHKLPIRWTRILPVKFFGGILSISSNMVLGREGPTIQMGGNIGKAISKITNLNQKRCDALIAGGAAAGLATAFNAPLAGVLFVMEEMRESFSLSFLQFKTVAICCVMATIVLQLILGDKPAIQMAIFQTPSIPYLGLFFILGLIVGFIGIAFNIVIMRVLFWMDAQSMNTRFIYVCSVACLVGVLSWVWPDLVGGGYSIIEHSLQITPGIVLLSLFFLIRFAMTMLCYGTGIPGGIFAPILSLGTLVGLLVASIFKVFISSTDIIIEPGMFAIAGMGALFSASVRAPVTGIVLLVEMTQNYGLILPLMMSCLTATTVTQLAGISPIYTQLLRRTLAANES